MDQASRAPPIMMIGLEKYSKELSLLLITVSGISIDEATGINLISEVGESRHQNG